MTCLLSWIDKNQKNAVFIADNKITGFDNYKTDKLMYLYGRWVIGIYGSSILKEPVDCIKYFDDKNNKPVIKNTVELIRIFHELSNTILPTKLRWYSKSGMTSDVYKQITESHGGYIILDSNDFVLYDYHLEKSLNIYSDFKKENLVELGQNKIHCYGFCDKSGYKNDFDPLGDFEKIFEFYTNKLNDVSKKYPKFVGGMGSLCKIKNGQMYFNTIHKNFQEYATNEILDEPYYVKIIK